MIKGGNLFWWPVLSSGALETLNSDLTMLTAFFNYYLSYDPLIDVVDDGPGDSAQGPVVQIPASMHHILHHLAVGYFGHDMEFAGAGRNESRGEELLKIAVNHRRALVRDSAQFRTGQSRRAW
jgi:hypothetical protein